MPINWDAEADRKLLLSILECSNVSIDNAAVAEKMRGHDMECTPNAIMKRLQRIRAMIKEGSGTPKSTSKTKTPTKRKGKTPDDDDDGELQTPSKKSKMTKGKSGGKAAGLPFEGLADDGEQDPIKKEEV